MRRLFYAGLLALLMGSCGVVKKKTSYATEPRTVTVEPDAPGDPARDNSGNPAAEAAGAGEPDRDIRREPARADAVVETALTFTGTRYRYGGTTRRGMDCSGLLYVSFQEHDFALPRVSHEMADEGRSVKVRQLQKGDLLFFKTTRRGGKINHVGMVVDVEGDEVRFIHSTTSRGVIVSSLREGFWNHAFVKATRVF